MLARQLAALNEDDYLAFENDSPERHEYVAGQVFAMTGSTLRHAAITGNLFVAMKMHLKGSPCRVFMTDIKVRVQRDRAYYYPDLVVTCDPKHAELTPDQRIIDAPTLIVEVLSESTAAVDRREKMFSYRKLATLKEYMLVSQTERRVELYRRIGEVGWEERLYEPTDAVDLASVDLVLSMDEIYDDSSL